mmetsp:Transcript_45361/g.119077  ORF Transcript_45361/g.119077 Transcript_45361/m.119077 type:complete len:250 (+) Transcript_45361:473-1222(+)
MPEGGILHRVHLVEIAVGRLQVLPAHARVRLVRQIRRVVARLDEHEVACQLEGVVERRAALTLRLIFFDRLLLLLLALLLGRRLEVGQLHLHLLERLLLLEPLDLLHVQPSSKVEANVAEGEDEGDDRHKDRDQRAEEEAGIVARRRWRQRARRRGWQARWQHRRRREGRVPACHVEVAERRARWHAVQARVLLGARREGEQEVGREAELCEAQRERVERVRVEDARKVDRVDVGAPAEHHEAHERDRM